MSIKSLDRRMEQIQFHLIKAEELTDEWWTAREEMDAVLNNAKLGLSLGASSDIFLRLATEAIREERNYISKINYHRNRAKRLMRKYENHSRYMSDKVEETHKSFYPDIAADTTITNNVYPMEKN